MRYKLEEFNEKNPEIDTSIQDATILWLNRLYLLNGEREKQNAELWVKLNDALNEAHSFKSENAILQGELNRLKKNLPT